MAVNLFRLSLALFLTLAISYWYYGESESSQYFNRVPRAASPPAPVWCSVDPSPRATPTAGYTVNIQWPQSWSYGSYRLELFYMDRTLAKTLVPSTSGNSFKWKVPATLEGAYEMRVTAKTTEDNTEFIYATNTFTVSALPPSDPIISVTSPTARESSWVVGAKNTIGFGYSESDGASWSADFYSIQAGSALYFGENVVSQKGMYDRTHTFTIPANWPNGRYIVNFYVFDASGNFRMANSQIFYITSFSAIYKATPDLVVVNTPSYQQIANKGQSLAISWSKTAQFSNFVIELFNYNTDLYRDPLVQTLVENLSGSTTSYSWTIPSSIPASRYYYVRVSGSIVGKDQIGAAYSNFFQIKSATGSEDGQMEAACSSNCKESVVGPDGNPLSGTSLGGFGGKVRISSKSNADILNGMSMIFAAPLVSLWNLIF